MNASDEFCQNLCMLLDVRTVHELPVIAREPPRWWQFIRRLEEADINASLEALGLSPINEAARSAFWREVAAGQGMDDAGGWIWRCWEAALGILPSTAHPGRIGFLDPHRTPC